MKRPNSLFTKGLLALAALAVLSCAEPTAPQVPAAPDESLVGSLLQNLHLLNCSPLPYDSTTQVVGHAGGTIHVGPHTLVVGPGALDHDVSITAVAPSGTTRLVRFQPEGLTFNHPVALTLSYQNCGLVSTLLPKKVVYTNDALDIVEVLLSLDNLFSKSVTGQVRHFSGYAVAW